MALALVGGPLGLHRFYAGRPQSGVWMILTLGGLGVWWLYDLVVLAAGEFRDGSGRRVQHWQIEDDSPAGTSPRRVDELTAHVDRLERHVAELAERLDFAERLLTQQRERDRLPRG